MSEIIACTIEGITFSFRKPRFENYQATHIIPPKTVLVGMIANALNQGESLYYQLLNDFWYTPILLRVESRFVDLWTAIQGKGDESGKRGIFYREHLFRAAYRIYMLSEKYSKTILDALTRPENIVYLGKSEDLLKIHSIETIPLMKESTNKVRDVIPLEWLPNVVSIDWKQPQFMYMFPPTEESLIERYQPPQYIKAHREQRSVENTLEVYVAVGGEFQLEESVEGIPVAEGFVHLI